MYDNSGSLALTGSGITILGQRVDLTALMVIGFVIIALGAGLMIAERLARSKH